MPDFERKVLVLDSRFEPVKVVTMQTAFVLMYTKRAEEVVESERVLRGVNRSYPIPWVLTLRGCQPKSRAQQGLRFSRQNVYLRDSFRCQYCLHHFASAALTLDHVLPVSRGGKRSWENIVTACKPCNLRKGNRLLEEAGMRVHNKPIRPILNPSLIFALRFGLTERNIPRVWRGFLNLKGLENILDDEVESTFLRQTVFSEKGLILT